MSLFVVGALAYLNIIIPKPQQTQAETHIWGNYDTCGDVHITASDLSCPTASKSYGTTATLSIQNKSYNGTHKVHYVWYSYFCTTPGLPDEGGKSCIERRIKYEGTVNVSNANNNVHVTVPESTPATFTSVDSSVADYKACGAYQNDFFILDIDGNKACHFGTFDYSGNNNWVTMLAGVCKTGVQCSKPTPTPTSTPTPSITPPVTPTPTTPAPPQLVVIKEVHNNHGGTKVSSDFMIHVNGNNASPSDFPGPDYPLRVAISAGFYSVTEKQLPGYTLVSQNGCSGYIHGGQIINCTLVNEDIPASLTVIKVVNNNHSGTKQAKDFPLYINGTRVTTGVSNTENPGDYTVAEDKQDGYHLVSISGDCDSNGHVHLNAGDTKTCVIENEDNGNVSCQMPSCNTNISGCSYPYPDTTSCSCGPLVCITQTPSQQNITVDVHQEQQQQQQQAVLGASVAPVVTSTQLPRTGSGTEIILTLLGLLPLGLKLRKFV